MHVWSDVHIDAQFIVILSVESNVFWHFGKLNFAMVKHQIGDHVLLGSGPHSNKWKFRHNDQRAKILCLH